MSMLACQPHRAIRRAVDTSYLILKSVTTCLMTSWTFLLAHEKLTCGRWHQWVKYFKYFYGGANETHDWSNAHKKAIRTEHIAVFRSPSNSYGLLRSSNYEVWSDVLMPVCVISMWLDQLYNYSDYLDWKISAMFYISTQCRVFLNPHMVDLMSLEFAYINTFQINTNWATTSNYFHDRLICWIVSQCNSWVCKIWKKSENSPSQLELCCFILENWNSCSFWLFSGADA